MRYIIQICTMIADIIIVGCAVYLLFHSNFEKVLGVLTIIVWFKSGGAMAWRPSVIKQFMKNGKEMGL